MAESRFFDVVALDVSESDFATMEHELNIHFVREPVNLGDFAGSVSRNIGAEHSALDVEPVLDLVAYLHRPFHTNSFKL